MLMGIGFDRVEVLELAVRMEENGKRLYKLLAQKAEGEEARQVFAALGKDEDGHIAKLKGMLAEAGALLPQDVYGEYQAYFEALADGSAFQCDEACQRLAGKAESYLEALRLAEFLEKDFLLFLYELKELVVGEAQELVRQMILDERGHLLRLVRLKSSC